MKNANVLVGINANTHKRLLAHEAATGDSIGDVIETALSEWLEAIAPVRARYVAMNKGLPTRPASDAS